jgi:hypothetical protein
MTLADLLAAVAADVGYDAIPSAVVTARLTRYLNEGLRHILSMNEMGPLRSNTLTFSSVAGQKTYGLPQAFVSIDQMVDTTNNIRLRLMTQDQFRTIDPQEVSSGTPTHYVPLGYGPLGREPDQTGLWVVSNEPADTTQVVTVTGLIAAPIVGLTTGGTPTGPISATLNGTTRVQVGFHLDYVAVQTLTLNTATAGFVVLFDAAVGGHPLALIQIGQKTVQYVQLRLWPTPAGVYTYQVDGPMLISELTATSDIPILPADFQFMLTDYARMREYEYRDDSRAAVARAQFQEKLKYLRDRLIDPPDFRPRVGRIPDRSSNLGSFYPPGRF